MRRLLGFLLLVAITAIFLGLALYQVNFPQLIDALVHSDHRLLILAGGLTLLDYALRTARWQRFLAPTKSIPLARLFPVLIIGFALNNLLPGRPGELARPYRLGRRESVSRMLAFGTIVVERVADGLVLILFLVMALVAFKPFGLEPPFLAEEISFVTLLIFGVALLGLVFLLVREELALRLVQQVTHLLPARLRARLERMLRSFAVGLRSLRSPLDVMAIAILSIAIWCAESASFFLILAAFGALPRFSSRVLASLVMMALVNLGIMIPAAPGGLGPYEAVGVFALSTFQLNETLSASIALAAHSLQYLLVTGPGVLLAWREGISLMRIRNDNEPENAQRDERTWRVDTNMILVSMH